jgi:DNA-3-methyladenine glycosylase
MLHLLYNIAMPLSPLPVSFYNRSAVDVARGLLGTRLVRLIGTRRVSGYVIETEAYEGESDLACHARFGRTQRTEVMYGRAGRAYIYFIYGMHWMLNVVAEPEERPAAVLIRAILADEGQDIIAAQRAGVRPRDWTNGPARLCRALDIDGHLNGIDLTDPQGKLWLEAGLAVPAESVVSGPRVGIENVPEPWRSIPWRFLVQPGKNGVGFPTLPPGSKTGK